MKYFSTNNSAPLLDFKEATIAGLAPDKGLYFPEKIPVFDTLLLSAFATKTKGDIAFEVMRPLVGKSIDEASLFQICSETIGFNIPLVKITEQIFSLELYHGPTLAFKDVGARFMSRCLAYFNRNNEREVTVLVATSGDTGSAVAHGFFGVKGVRVVILYPSGKVSAIQEKQLTTLGENITALEVAGTFDDCQKMVKQAFADSSLSKTLQLTSANSINIARWLPQQIYYLLAAQQWQEKQPPIICVPSGNFGNIAAGLLAKKSGMAVTHFMAACNSNDPFVHYLQTGAYRPKPAIATISNAMDVGDPSNLVRVNKLFNDNFSLLLQAVSANTISDKVTRETIKRVFANHQYLLDPHAAVAFATIEKKLLQSPTQKGYILSTAHPCKFADVVEESAGTKIEIPEAIQSILKKEKCSIKMDATYESLRAFLLH